MSSAKLEVGSRHKYHPVYAPYAKRTFKLTSNQKSRLATGMSPRGLADSTGRQPLAVRDDSNGEHGTRCEDVRRLRSHEQKVAEAEMYLGCAEVL